MRSTLIDIAREAGVSSATVDRVLNNRPGVRTRTREVVTEVARRMGYIASNGGSSPDDPARLAFDFVLPAGTNSFIEELRQQLHQQGNALRDVSATVHSIEGFNPFTLAEKLKELEGRSSGVGVVGIDHPAVREAMRSLAKSGTPVITLISDIHHVPRAGYVGIDNRSAGRLAGYLMGRLLGPGDHKVALFAGSLSYRGHEEREMGFRHILAEEFPNLEIVELREMRDDREKAFQEASALLDRHDDLAGIYNIGAGNQGIGRALKERNRGRSVVFVGHEATEGNKALLLDGTLDAVIDQNPRVEAREALNILTNSIRGLTCELHPPRLQIVFRENIPEI